MTKEIGIQVERQNHGDWIKVYIPYRSNERTFALLQNEYGEILRRVQLNEGNNSIDISHITGTSVNLKIETAYETILKQIKLIL